MEKVLQTSAADPTPHKRKRQSSDDKMAPREKKKRQQNATVKQIRQESDNNSTEQRIYELSSSANTCSADFKKKYSKMHRIGEGGFGSVYAGLRRLDSFPVAIKYIPLTKVRWQKVDYQGKKYDIILEVALMLKAAGLPGSSGQSAAVSLLDWYIRRQKLILVMERPQRCMSLHRYLEQRGGSLTEREAKVILKQLVDATVDMHSKGVFHRDIKLENVLLSIAGDRAVVRVVDFGCGDFSSEATYEGLCGTRRYFPPEWFTAETYWARPTTVWQLGALLYSLLGGQRDFSTKDFLDNRIGINSSLSTEMKTLLGLCLNTNPYQRVPLSQLQLHPALTELSSTNPEPPSSVRPSGRDLLGPTGAQLTPM